MTYIYFIQEGDNGPVKIGRAMDVEYRLRVLQAGNPYRLHLLAKFLVKDSSVEQKVHNLLDHSRVDREWFDATEAKKLIEFWKAGKVVSWLESQKELPIEDRVVL